MSEEVLLAQYNSNPGAQSMDIFMAWLDTSIVILGGLPGMLLLDFPLLLMAIFFHKIILINEL